VTDGVIERERNPIEVVVFDLGGVLIDWNPRHLFRRLFQDEARMEHFLSEVCSPEWNLQQDAGRTWSEALAEVTARHPDYEEMIAAYHDRWPEMLGGELPDTVALLEDLKALGLRLYALTNWSHETFPLTRRRFAFLDWFEAIVVSGEEKLLKPDPEIFHRLLTRCDIVPERAAYVDDSSANVAVAARIGFHARQFVDADRLRRELIAMGVPLAGRR
jgi:2-haloacid dehalogenase